jgi:membrane associated rhomboid family serine protease
LSPGIVTSASEQVPPPPWMTLFLSAVCLAVKFLHATLSPMAQRALVEVGGATPRDLAAMLAQPLGSWFDAGFWTLFTSPFIHASWLHLLGNLVYLWVFGLAVERRLGALGLAAVYLVGGALAAGVLAFSAPTVTTPVIGASGAVSAVVGAYLGLFPSRRIGLYLPLGLYLQFARVPALVVIGSWFTLQLLYTVFGPMEGAVAWWTHVVGFAVGLMAALLARAFASIRR